MRLRFFTGLVVLFSSLQALACEEARSIHQEAGLQFDLSVYKADNPQGKNLIIIPPTGGTNLIDRSYAKRFCENNFDVYLINDWQRPGEDTPDLEVHQRFYTNAQRAIAAVVKSLPNSFIGILGTSVGALHASISATTLEEIDAAFLIVGGLPIAEVVVTSDQQAMRDLRSIRQMRYHFKSDDENIAAINKVFSLEPTKQAALKNKKQIGVVISEDDKTVPYPTQQNLEAFFKPKKVIAMNNNHFWAIVKTWLFHSSELVDFFKEAARQKKTN